MSTTINNTTLIPVISDLVIAGDPQMKKTKHEKTSAESEYSSNLSLRINELEMAIGQNNSTTMGRAYAIREEASRVSLSTQEDKSDLETPLDPSKK